MNMSQNINNGWSTFQGKKRPSKVLCTGHQEVSYSTTTPQTETTHGQVNDRRPLTSKARKYKKTNWTVGEKIIILECFAYSRHECWCRQKDKIFEGQINASNLPKEKVEETTIKKLTAIVSQIRKYLTPQ